MPSDVGYTFTHTPTQTRTQEPTLTAPISIDADVMDVLVGHLGNFALGMMATFIRYQDEIPDEAAAQFKQHIDAWVANAGEFLPLEQWIEEMRKEQDEE